MTKTTWILLALSAIACGDNDSECVRPKGLHTFDARLAEQGPNFNCDVMVTDTVDFDNDRCLQSRSFDSTTCVWEGTGTCDGATVYFRVDDWPNAFYLVSVDNVPLCAYEAVVR